MLVAQVEASPEWSASPLLQAAGASGFICLPVPGQGGLDSAVLALSRNPLPAFTAEDLYQRLQSARRQLKPLLLSSSPLPKSGLVLIRLTLPLKRSMCWSSSESSTCRICEWPSP